MRKPTFWFPTWSDTNQAVQLQEMARRWKFQILKVEGLYYSCRENKGADQLRGYREADLRFCFSHMQHVGFLTSRLLCQRHWHRQAYTSTKLYNRKFSYTETKFSYIKFLNCETLGGCYRGMEIGFLVTGLTLFMAYLSMPMKRSRKGGHALSPFFGPFRSQNMKVTVQQFLLDVLLVE